MRLEKAIDSLFEYLTKEQIFGLLWPKDHSPIVARRRAELITSRVRMVAASFAVLTPTWIAIDYFLFAWPLWGYLALMRIVATLAFALVALVFHKSRRMPVGWAALAFLLAVPTLFFVATNPLMSHFEMSGAAETVSMGYAFLPFVMLAGLSIFPITALEGLVFGMPLVLATFLVALADQSLIPFNSYLGAMWLLMLVAVVATFAGMSQLHFMMQLVEQSSHDLLTRAYTRRVGEELVAVQFNASERADTQLAMCFIDLDNFKQINDDFGHEEGDDTLRAAAATLRQVLRRSDILVRWGGEEFLVVMPSTSAEGAIKAFRRILDSGLGIRPDGRPQTASMGLAERRKDGLQTWSELVERADQRMYKAKKSGRDRLVDAEGETHLPAGR